MGCSQTEERDLFMKRILKKWTISLGLALPLALGLVACDLQQAAEKDNDSEEGDIAPEISQYVIPDQIELVSPSQTNVELDSSSWAIKPPFYGAGQEPFWRLELNDGWFIFQRLGLPEIEAMVVAPEKTDEGDVFNLDGVTITMKVGSCSNAQANEPVRGAITLVHDEVSYQGCVYRGATQSEDPSEAASDTNSSNWTRDIGIFAIEVDACMRALDKLSANASKKAVVTAMQRASGQTTFVVETGRRNEFLCLAKDTGGIESFEALEKKNKQDWMNASGRFMRVESGPPPRACLDAKPVIVDNQLTGYLLPRSCRP